MCVYLHTLTNETAVSQKMIVVCDPLGLRQASNEETSTRGGVVDHADSAFEHDSWQTICLHTYIYIYMY